MADTHNDITKILTTILKNKSMPKIIVVIVMILIGIITKGKINFSQLGSVLNKPEIAQEQPNSEPSQSEQISQQNPQPESKPAPAAIENQTQAQDEYIQLNNIEIPACASEHHNKDHLIRKFQNYMLCYRESYEQPEWVAYLLSKEMLKRNSGRSNDFRPDPQIETGSASLSDYRGSGYSRGHLAPAADFAFDEKAVSETFFMSNMSPQTKEFNAGLWQNLEIQVRTWAKRFGRIYVVSGPLLEKNASEYASIGKNKVSVPEYYYKAILAPAYKDNADKSSPDDAKSVEAIGFIMPNEDTQIPIWNYAVPIDEIEARTGIDFFPLLNDATEEKCEKSFNIDFWK
ncbi:MAG: DNA/RNA non-specific endonuclease [Treponema sp.]|nr:DNA/RNA non-specific endonuclease [Treponema sp.]